MGISMSCQRVIDVIPNEVEESRDATDRSVAGCLDFARHDKHGNSIVNRRSVFYWLIAIVIVALAIATAFYFDDLVRDFIAQHQIKSLRKAMATVSKVGDWPSHFVAGLIGLGIAWRRGNKKWMRIFLSMLIALSVAGVVGRGIKIAAGRARPSVSAQDVWEQHRFSSKYHAFPSGHVAASTGFFGVLIFTRRRIGLACLPIPIVIGFSRMYVGAHYLSDVICAAILGTSCAFIIARLLLREIENRKLAWRRG
jgi:membrane-associated phospholipid phosphatase